MALSKTEFIAGLQCAKHIFLRVHHPELIEITDSLAIATGKVAEAHARREFPGAILVERDNPTIDPFVKTQALLNDSSVDAVFEAAVAGGGLALFVDVLSREGKNWVLTEIKSASKVKDEHIDDVTIQAVVLERANIPVSRFELMYINSDFIYQGGHHYENLFIREDITEQVQAHKGFIKNQLPNMILKAKYFLQVLYRRLSRVLFLSSSLYRFVSSISPDATKRSLLVNYPFFSSLN